MRSIDPSQPEGSWVELVRLMRSAESIPLAQADRSWFSKVPVVRSLQEDRATGVDVPSQCWILAPDIAILRPPTLAPGAETILIREEFLAAISDAICCYRTGLDAWTTQPEPQPQVAQPEDIDALDIYPALPAIDNPFTAPDLAAPRAPLPRANMILTGQPGIGVFLPVHYFYCIELADETGKSICLFIIYVLRIAACLPTIFVFCEDKLLFFDGNSEIFYISLAQFATNEAKHIIPSNTWILFDSNPNLIAPHVAILESGYFIVQATSPRKFCTEWKSKVCAYKWTMKTWSLSELLIACVSFLCCFGSDHRSPRFQACTSEVPSE